MKEPQGQAWTQPRGPGAEWPRSFPGEAHFLAQFLCFLPRKLISLDSPPASPPPSSHLPSKRHVSSFIPRPHRVKIVRLPHACICGPEVDFEPTALDEIGHFQGGVAIRGNLFYTHASVHTLYTDRQKCTHI